MPTQVADSVELLHQEKFTDYLPVTGKRIATSDVAQESLLKRFMLDEDAIQSVDINGNPICDSYSTNEAEYSDELLTSDAWNAQFALSLLDANSDDVFEFTANTHDLTGILELDTEDVCSLLEDEEGNLLITQNDQELESEQLHTQASDCIAESHQISTELSEVYAYRDKNGHQRGICSKCGHDRAINFHWKKRHQECVSCRLKDTNFDICSKCKKKWKLRQKDNCISLWESGSVV